MWPAGLPPPACRCQSWGSGDTLVRGGEEVKDGATEPFSPSSVVQAAQQSGSQHSAPGEGRTSHCSQELKRKEYAGQLAGKCNRVV